MYSLIFIINLQLYILGENYIIQGTDISHADTIREQISLGYKGPKVLKGQNQVYIAFQLLHVPVQYNQKMFKNNSGELQEFLCTSCGHTFSPFLKLIHFGNFPKHHTFNKHQGLNSYHFWPNKNQLKGMNLSAIIHSHMVKV